MSNANTNTTAKANKVAKIEKPVIIAKPNETGKKLEKRVSPLQAAKAQVSKEITFAQSTLSYWVKMLSNTESAKKFVAELGTAYDCKVSIASIQKLNVSELGAKLSDKQKSAIAERIAKYVAKYPESKGKFQGWTKSAFLGAICAYYRPVKAAKVK